MATDVSTAFPQLDLAPNTTITITMDDANATIDKLNVYGYTPDRESSAEPQPILPIFAYGPAP